MADGASTQTRVLITGAAGRIGTAFVAEYGHRYRFRLADIPGAVMDAPGPHEVIAFDIADLRAFRAACDGIDVVVHLAADPSPEADFYGSLLNNNILGAFNAFRAAKDAGCRRLIFASSVHAVMGYGQDNPVPDGAPVKPMNFYGATKTWGESLAHVFAYSEGLSSIAIRIGAYDAPWIREHPTDDNLSAYISARDLNQLIVRAIETPDVPFAIVHGISNNRVKRLDLAETIRLLGYAPQDDGFAIAGI